MKVEDIMGRLVGVTIAGADDSVDPLAMLEFSREYPFVEWGILINGKRSIKDDKPRYPSYKWITSLPQPSRTVDIKYSAHFCGELCKDIVKKSNETIFNIFHCDGVINLFDRWQFNRAADYLMDELDIYSEDPLWAECVIKIRQACYIASKLYSVDLPYESIIDRYHSADDSMISSLVMQNMPESVQLLMDEAISFNEINEYMNEEILEDPNFDLCSNIILNSNVLKRMAIMPIILQVYDKKSACFADLMYKAVGNSCGISILHDSSQGKGKRIYDFKPHMFGDQTGYAGGITPLNVDTVIQGVLLANAENNASLWLDMETGVRDKSDNLDFSKVEAVLESVKPYIEE